MGDLKVIRDKKSHDYATDSDTLKNFKVTSQILAGLGYQVKDEEIKASDVAMFFEVIKLCRRANLRGRQPDNESVLDSVEDNVNYTCLQYACLVDEDKLRVEPLTQEGIHKEVGFRFDNPQPPIEQDFTTFKELTDAEWLEGYNKWSQDRVTEPSPLGLYVEKKNWKVNGFWEVGCYYRSAKDSGIIYEFIGKDPETSDLFKFKKLGTDEIIFYTPMALDQLQLVEV